MPYLAFMSRSQWNPRMQNLGGGKTHPATQVLPAKTKTGEYILRLFYKLAHI